MSETTPASSGLHSGTASEATRTTVSTSSGAITPSRSSERSSSGTITSSSVALTTTASQSSTQPSSSSSGGSSGIIGNQSPAAPASSSYSSFALTRSPSTSSFPVSTVSNSTSSVVEFSSTYAPRPTGTSLTDNTSTWATNCSTSPANSVYITSLPSNSAVSTQSAVLSSGSRSVTRSDPSTTSTSAPETSPTDSPQLSAHNVIVDSGTCAGLGLPIVIGREGTPLQLKRLNGGQYITTLDVDELGAGGGYVFLSDSGQRCGQYGVCASVTVEFNLDGLIVGLAMMGDRGETMYPMSIWVTNGQQYDNTPADSPDTKYNCWGWPDTGCPFAHMRPSDPSYVITTTNQNASVYITFCPPDGPDPASIGPNPNPLNQDTDTEVTNVIISVASTAPVSDFLVPMIPGYHGFMTSTESDSSMLTRFTAPTPSTTPSPPEDTQTAPFCLLDETVHCHEHFTYVIIDQTRTAIVGETFSTSVPSPTPTWFATMFPTFINIDTTTMLSFSTIVPAPTRLQPQTHQITSSIGPSPTSFGPQSSLTGYSGTMLVPTTTTNSLGMPITTSVMSGTIIPTFSVVTNSQGLVTNVAYNSTNVFQPTPPPEKLYTLTSWSTYMTINSSTIPAVGGQVGVLTTIPGTYALEPSTTVPIEVLSSISAESTRTSLPSVSLPSESARTDSVGTSSGKGGTVAAAVAGSLVGLALFSAFICFMCAGYRRRRQRTTDYASHRSPTGGSAPGSIGLQDERSSLDIDSEPRPRQSFVEPWVEPRPPLYHTKMQGEMEEYACGGHNNTLSSIHSSHENDQASPRAQISPIFSPMQSTPPPATRPAPVDSQAAGGVDRPESPHNAIPPLYNEAWNIGHTSGG
ncbi:hypothetical protein RhiLY_04802 [Ceratobasidium sp. AG-Ba]|nr:hypothetical protein RhiLY_04802 [Ceratobasidium sp. AG-Ba]